MTRESTGTSTALSSDASLRFDWTKSEVQSIYRMPLPDLLFRAQTIHRQFHPPDRVQTCQLISIKTGGCPEDCAYCPQSAHYEADVERQGLLDPQHVISVARDAASRGVTRFCMGAAWREAPNGRDFDKVLEMVHGVSTLGMEVCCTLGMLTESQRAWGFETNFGGLAHFSVVKANQLMPKPRHLTWEEAATPGLVNSTAFRQLVSDNGASMKQGHNILIWGASGGLGAYATQYALAGGAIPVCVVSSERKAALCRSMGAELIINRAAEGYQFWKDEHTQDPKEWKRFGAQIRELTGGEDVDVVFEHPGRETFGASVYVTRKGGTIVTCASTSGYMHTYDNRYLWMSLKRIIGSHFANYREAWQANRLIAKGMIHPTTSAVYPLEKTGQAALDVHRNLHHGKVAVLCLAPHEGLGVRDHLLREKHLTEINRFRNE